MGAKKKLEPLSEIGMDDLLRDDARYFIGLMAAQSLRLIGQITFFLSADQKVAMANPAHVFLDEKAFIHDDVEERPYKYVRPILGSGRPQAVAWRDGELWEIEFLDEEPEEADRS
jgi:hypothetical protein